MTHFKKCMFWYFANFAHYLTNQWTISFRQIAPFSDKLTINLFFNHFVNSINKSEIIDIALQLWVSALHNQTIFMLAVKWFTDNQAGGTRGGRDAVDILRERFAAGEIDEEEFERRKKALER